MTSKFTIDPGKYTTVLTSCGRFDLLGETVASFLQHFATDKVIVSEYPSLIHISEPTPPS